MEATGIQLKPETYIERLLRKKKNICIQFVQRRPRVFDVGPTMYKCYTNILCLLGIASNNLQTRHFFLAEFAQSVHERDLKLDFITLCNFWESKNYPAFTH